MGGKKCSPALCCKVSKVWKFTWTAELAFLRFVDEVIRPTTRGSVENAPKLSQATITLRNFGDLGAPKPK